MNTIDIMNGKEDPEKVAKSKATLDRWDAVAKSKATETIDILAGVPDPKARSRDPQRARTMQLIAGAPHLTAGTEDLTLDIVGDLHREFASTLIGHDIGLIEQRIRANNGRQTRKNKQAAIASAIGKTVDPVLKNALIGEYAAMDSYKDASEASLAATASIVPPLVDLTFYQSNTSLDAETFFEKFRNSANTNSKVTLDEVGNYFLGKSDEIGVLDAELVPNILELGVFPIEAIKMGLVTREVLGEDASISDFFLTGSAVHKIVVDGLLKTPPEKRAEFVDKVNKSLEKYFGTEAFGGLSNDLSRFGLNAEMMDALEEWRRDDPSVDWSRWVSDVAGVLSYLGVGALGKAAAKGTATKIYNSQHAYKASFNANLAATTEEGTKIIAQTIRDGNADEALRALATTREDLATAALPKPLVTTEHAPVARTISDVAIADMTTTVALAEDAAASSLPKAHWLVPKDEDAFRVKALQQIKKNLGVHISTSLSQIGMVDEAAETYQLRAFVGLDAKQGFPQLGTALDAQKLWQIGDDATVYRYDYVADTYTPMTAADVAATPLNTHGEFYLAKDYTVGFDSSLMGGLWRSRRSRAGFTGNWTTSLMHRFNGEMRNYINNSTRFEGAFLEKIRRVALPYNNMSSADRAVVDDIISTYNGERSFLPSELAARGLSDQQIAGYVSYRASMDALMSVENKALRQRMLAEGMRWLHVSDGAGGTEFSAAGRPILDATEARSSMFSSGGTKVLDADTGEVVHLSKEKTLAEYSNGNFLVKLSAPREVSENTEITHVLVRAGGKAAMHDLPAQVFNYVPGYMPKFVDHKFMIWAERLVLRDGVYVKDNYPIAHAHDLAEGEAHAKGLNAAADRPKGVRYFAAESDAVRSSWDNTHKARFEVENMMFYQTRSESLPEIGKRPTNVDPADALDRAYQLVGSHVLGGRVLENMQAQWIKQYGQYFPKLGNSFPQTKEALLTEAKYVGKEARAEVQDAVALFDSINAMRHGPLWSDKLRARAVAEGLGMWLASSRIPGVNATGRWLVGNPDPVYALRTAAFATQLLTTPWKQWLVNAPTLALHIGMDPLKATAAMTEEAWYLSVMYQAEKANVKANPNIFLRTALKLNDAVAEADMKAMFKAFKDTGMSEIHATHTAMDRSVFGSGAVGVVPSAFKKAMYVGGEVGQASAERYATASAFALASRIHAEKIGKPLAAFSKKEWEAVVDSASQISLNMTKADQFNYQRGAFSALMQYFAVRHKAVLAITTGDTMTRNQKIGSSIAMATLFGTEGIGATYAVQYMMDSLGIQWKDLAEELGTDPVELKRTVTGASVDLAYNSILDEVFNEEGSEASISASISPLSGLDKELMVAGMLIGNIGDSSYSFDQVLGPSGSVLGNIGNTLDTVRKLGTLDISTADKFAIVARDMTTVFSGGSNLQKAAMGYALGQMVNKYGNPVANATVGELASQGVFGLQNQEALELYTVKSILGMDGPIQDKALSAESADWARWIVSKVRTSGSFEDASARIGYATMLLDALAEAPEVNPDFIGQVRKEVQRQLRDAGDPLNQKFYEHIAKEISKGKVDDPVQVMNVLLNTNYAMKNPQFYNAVSDMLDSKKATFAKEEARKENAK